MTDIEETIFEKIIQYDQSRVDFVLDKLAEFKKRKKAKRTFRVKDLHLTKKELLTLHFMGWNLEPDPDKLSTYRIKC